MVFGKRKDARSVPSLVTVHGRAFTCLVCDCDQFTAREVLMNTPGMELFDLAWANKSSLGVICAGCGYLHEFLGDAVQFWDASAGYPQGQEQ